MKMLCFCEKSIFTLASSIVFVGTAAALSQGMVTFDGAADFSGTTYSESGMSFHVVLPRGGAFDYMGGVPGGGIYGNLAYNDTPYLIFYRQNNPYSKVSLGLENGSGFGLTSVQLADPNAPSLSPVSISFIGYLAGGASVTNTFTTPGNGATTFVTYNFDSNFKSGLTSVDIIAPRWAMDNLVFAVPEPGSLGLTAIGLVMLCAWRKRSSGPGNRDPEPGS